MEERTEIIRKWINARKERNEIKKCIFYITTQNVLMYTRMKK